jgi:hypothetical protein
MSIFRILLFVLILVSGKSFSLTCDELNGSYVISQEISPTYLGFFGNEFSSDSIQNTFGTYGNSFNSTSVRNTFGTYGNSFSSHSISNQYTTTPPAIYKHRTLIGYLTNNSFVSGGVSLAAIDASCYFTATSAWDNPSPITNVSYVSNETSISLAWSGGFGAESFSVYQCPNNDCSNAILLINTTASRALISGLAANTIYTFLIAGINSGSYNFGIGVPASINTQTLASTPLDTIAPEITLNGGSTIYINVFDSFIDPGLIATDNVDNSVQTYVSGEVNTSLIGTYTLTYGAEDSSNNTAFVQRTVIVEDKISPVINIIGNQIIEINQFEDYIDAGAEAIDNYDGTVSVTTNGSVDTSLVGQYEIEYQAQDSSGNISTVMRLVTINGLDMQPPSIVLVGDTNITVEINTEYSEPGVTATDDVDGPLTVQISDNLNMALAGTYTILYSAEDAAGNISYMERYVTVQEGTAAVETWDFDQDGNADALTDGLLLLRYTFNLRGASLTDGAISSSSLLTPEEVEANVAEATNGLADIDGNGAVDALTDGLMLLRYLFNLRGDSLIAGAVKNDATRTPAADIEAYIQSYMP